MTVVQHGGFASAAHSLHLSPASISSHIKALEQTLGTTLFNRTTRSVSLTPEGERYYDVCKEVLLRLEAVEESLTSSGEKQLVSGIVTIDIPADMGKALVLPRILEFQGLYPRVKVHVTSSAHQFDTNRYDFDLMIRSILGPMENSSLIARPLWSSPIVFAASPEYLEQHGEPETPEELKNHKCIGFIDPLTNRLWEWFFYDGGQKQSMNLNCSLAFSDHSLRIQAALAHAGVINTLDHSVLEHVERGDLQVILKKYTLSGSPIYLFHPQKKYLSQAKIAFIDFLANAYRSNEETATG